MVAKLAVHRKREKLGTKTAPSAQKVQCNIHKRTKNPRHVSTRSAFSSTMCTRALLDDNDDNLTS